MPRRWFSPVAAACSVLVACYGPSPTDNEDLEAEWDILPRVAEGAYRSDQFVHVTPAPYPSDVATGKTVDVWVSNDGWSEFLRVAPDRTGTGVVAPRQTVIVREVLVDGAVESLTVMARAEPGFSPSHGDWWFGVLDASGWPTLQDGEPVIGALDGQCATCHDQRADDGYLFGVPDAARDPALPVSASYHAPWRE